MIDNEDRVSEQVKLFEAEYRRALELSKSPDTLKWCIFPTGSREVEENVLRLMLSNMLENISGVYVMNMVDDVKILQILTLMRDEYNKRQKDTLNIASNPDYKLTLGVI